MGPEWGKASFDDLVPSNIGLLLEEFVVGLGKECWYWKCVLVSPLVDGVSD
jgi:hypothetical protein